MGDLRQGLFVRERLICRTVRIVTTAAGLLGWNLEAELNGAFTIHHNVHPTIVASGAMARLTLNAVLRAEGGFKSAGSLTVAGCMAGEALFVFMRRFRKV